MFGEKYLTHPEIITKRNVGKTLPGGILELRLAGDCYRVGGLSDEHQALIQKIYPNCCGTPNDGALERIDISVYYERGSEFKEIKLKGWHYDLDMAFSDTMVQIVGLGFAAKIIWRPRLESYLWTRENENEAFRGVFENFLRILVAYRLLERGGALLHSAAFAEDTKAFLFVGRSGHGKSTVSAITLRAGKLVLSDDLNAVVIDGDSLWVLWVPFYGDVASPFCEGQRYPVKAFYLLEKSDRNVVSNESKARMLAHLFSCSPYVNRDPHHYVRLMENLSQMCRQVDCYRLEFRRDGGFLNLLKESQDSAEGAMRTGLDHISSTS